MRIRAPAKVNLSVRMAGTSLEQDGDIAHGQKQPSRRIRERGEAEMPIESHRVIVDCVHYNGGGADAGRLLEGAVQRVDKQKFAQALSLMSQVNGQAAEECGGKTGIRGKALRKGVRQLA